MRTERRDVEVLGDEISYLTAGDGPLVVLVHGTFWSKVWAPVLEAIAAGGRRAVAPDFPGFGRSGGELGVRQADAASLSTWLERFVDALGAGPVSVIGGHDIGGAVAQRYAVEHRAEVDALVLMNSVLYDSWPVPAVERFRDPEVRDATTVDALVDARAASLDKAVTRPLDPAERDAWLEPWRDARRARSWMAMAAAADARYTLEIADALAGGALPMLLVWGDEDEFQPVRYAERLVAETARRAELVRIPGARHIPTADAPDAVADALRAFLERLSAA